MKLREKYPVLQNPSYVKDMIVSSVYSTMKIEGQEVSREKIKELYLEVQNEKSSQRK